MAQCCVSYREVLCAGATGNVDGDGGCDLKGGGCLYLGKVMNKGGKNRARRYKCYY